jgi:hypothetical protein
MNASRCQRVRSLQDPLRNSPGSTRSGDQLRKLLVVPIETTRAPPVNLLYARQKRATARESFVLVIGLIFAIVLSGEELFSELKPLLLSSI